ncbi:MAG TPA: polyphosphate kinase 2 family protein [Phycisphaerales bacterium]|nr:polyphosphate kinase 2 family protein [Phycisphaerales bacterium]
MKISKELRVDPGQAVDLRAIDPDATPSAKKEDADKLLAEHVLEMDRLQYLLYAENKHALLIVLQGMDAAGKDGTIRHVMSGMNPQGVKVTSFKTPSAEEQDHDFLWRIHKAVPCKGEVGVFNRSHYEDVVVVRVHDLAPKDVWKARYEQINAFEKMLTDCGVTILKFFLHISKDEQLERLKARVTDPTRNWKLSPTDFAERKRWDDYTNAYEDALEKCSTSWAPWHIVPANKKWYRNLVISQVIVDTLRGFDMRYPPAACDLSTLKIE